MRLAVHSLLIRHISEIYIPIKTIFVFPEDGVLPQHYKLEFFLMAFALRDS